MGRKIEMLSSSLDSNQQFFPKRLWRQQNAGSASSTPKQVTQRVWGLLGRKRVQSCPPWHSDNRGRTLAPGPTLVEELPKAASRVVSGSPVAAAKKAQHWKALSPNWWEATGLAIVKEVSLFTQRTGSLVESCRSPSPSFNLLERKLKGERQSNFWNVSQLNFSFLVYPKPEYNWP